jgi:2-iminobutanoate/2-iminopropanoate deaminase
MPGPDLTGKPERLRAPAAAPPARVRRFVAPGAPDVRPDGTVDTGLEAQMRRAWLNLFDVMKKAGYEKRHLVQTTVSIAEGGQTRLYRMMRDRMLGGHLVPSSCIHVAGFGAPGHLVQIEGEAVKE